jgi:E2F/DP family winged-helix DNA-binding domain
VERRRIYDIINVLESLGCVHREAKNVYAWNTIKHLEEKLAELKENSAKVVCGPRESSASAAAAASTVHRGPGSLPLQPREMDLNARNVFESGGFTRSAAAFPEMLEKPASGNRKEKSLGILCQRFVQLFLLAENHIVGLDEAATVLSDGTTLPPAHEPLSKDASAKILKTKVRRLYDIANVLTSLCLIEKVSSRTRKPCFRWIGADENNALETLRGEPRHPSAETTAPGSASRPTNSASKAALPPLKRHLSSIDGSFSAGSVAGPIGNRGPKRRKAAAAARKPASLPSPNAVEEHLPTEYATMWKQFVTYAQSHGNINPLEAAAAIANATKAASAAARSESVPAAVPANGEADRSSAALPSLPARRMRLPSSSPVSLDDGDVDDSMPLLTPLSTQPGVAANVELKECKAESGDVTSPVKEVAERGLSGGGFAHSTPKRLMAAQQLSALSRTCARPETSSAALSPPRAPLGPSESGDAGENGFAREGKVGAAHNAESKRTPSADGEALDKPDAVARTPVPPSMAHADMYRYATSQEAIDEYMSQARDAGPEYERAANKWLSSIREWQSMWGPFSRNHSHAQSVAPSPVTPAALSNAHSTTTPETKKARADGPSDTRRSNLANGNEA